MKKYLIPIAALVAINFQSFSACAATSEELAERSDQFIDSRLELIKLASGDCVYNFSAFHFMNTILTNTGAQLTEKISTLLEQSDKEAQADSKISKCDLFDRKLIRLERHSSNILENSSQILEKCEKKIPRQLFIKINKATKEDLEAAVKVIQILQRVDLKNVSACRDLSSVLTKEFSNELR